MRYCGICGRSELELSKLFPGAPDSVLIELEYVTICYECREKAKSDPVHDITEDIPPEIRAMVGRSADEICLALNLPYEAPYQSIIDHASRMQNEKMSSWSLFLIWRNGATIWRSPDGLSKAIVSRDGSVIIEDT